MKKSSVLQVGNGYCDVIGADLRTECAGPWIKGVASSGQRDVPMRQLSGAGCKKVFREVTGVLSYWACPSKLIGLVPGGM